MTETPEPGAKRDARQLQTRSASGKCSFTTRQGSQIRSGGLDGLGINPCMQVQRKRLTQERG